MSNKEIIEDLEDLKNKYAKSADQQEREVTHASRFGDQWDVEKANILLVAFRNTIEDLDALIQKLKNNV